MASKIINQEKNIVTVEITVDGQEVEKAYKQASQNLGQKVSVPGFRKGKVPAEILSKHVGEGSIIEEAMDIMLPAAYSQALLDLDLDPIDRPKVDIVSFEKKGPAVFTVELQLVPKGILGDYTGLKLERKLINLDETYIDNEIEAMRTKTAKIETVEDPAENGDTVVIDFEGYVDEVKFDGGTGSKFPLELGSNSFIPGFEEQLVGIKAGENREVNVKFPDEYHSEDLKGKESVFKVLAHEVKRKKLSELNDDFAKEVSDFDTLEELRNDVKMSVTNQKQQQADNALRAQALDLAIEKLEVEVPEIMIEERTNQFLKDIEGDLQQQGMDLQKYFELTGMTEEKVRSEYRANAEKHIKRDILLDEVAMAEKIEVTPADLEKEINAISQIYGQDKAMLETYFQAPENTKMLSKGIKREKALQSILDKAEITDVKEEK
ncbi:MAG: trigger factor [Firmicutes bacterium]|nr:trigger factor [Bacillota bacterium]